MIFMRMRLVELKWSLAMLFGCAICGMSGVLALCLPYLFVIFALAGLYGVTVTAGLLDVFTIFFALGAAIGLPRVADHFVDGFRSEIEPLRAQRRDR